MAIGGFITGGLGSFGSPSLYITDGLFSGNQIFYVGQARTSWSVAYPLSTSGTIGGAYFAGTTGGLSSVTGFVPHSPVTWSGSTPGASASVVNE